MGIGALPLVGRLVEAQILKKDTPSPPKCSIHMPVITDTGKHPRLLIKDGRFQLPSQSQTKPTSIFPHWSTDRQTVGRALRGR